MSDDVKSEAPAVPGVWTAAVIVMTMGFVGVCAGGIWWLYPTVRSPSVQPPAAFAPSRLEVTPVQEYSAYLAHQRALLSGADGRLPIRDAMAAVAQRGSLAPETRQ